MEGSPLHREQIELVYAHPREVRTAQSQLFRKDERARVLRKVKLPPRAALHLGLEPQLSREEKALLERGKVAIGLAPWLLYRRSRSSMSRDSGRSAPRC